MSMHSMAIINGSKRKTRLESETGSSGDKLVLKRRSITESGLTGSWETKTQ